MSQLPKDNAEKQEYINNASDVIRNVSIPGIMGQNALQEIDTQKSMTILESVRKYPRAVFFSCLMSLCIIMEGYDTALIGNFYGLSQFNKRFGQPVNDGSGDYQLTSTWQSGLQNGTAVGQLIGLLLAGYIADRFGYVKSIIGAQIFLICTIFLLFFATNIKVLFAGYVLCGIPWGFFQTLTTTYAADVTPLRLRHILTTFVNMCWVIGQFLSVGILKGLLTFESNWAWRIPYAIQWVWPPIIIVGMLFAPESPTWLVKMGRNDDALRSLKKLSNGSVEGLDSQLALIVHTNELEKAMMADSESLSYLECFKGTNRRRTELTCGVWMIQVLCGVWFGSNIVYFLQRGGMNEDDSFSVGLGQQAASLVGTGLSWYVMTKVGRRTLYLGGMAVMLGVLLIVGIMGIPHEQSAINWASGALMICFVIAFQLTVGPVCYCLVTEMPSTRLRIKTVVIARFAYNVVAIGANFLNPPLLNPLAWNLRGKAGFVWAATNAIMLVWAFFRLPETKGLTLAEIDARFEAGVSARSFQTADSSIDGYITETLEQKTEKSL